MLLALGAARRRLDALWALCVLGGTLALATITKALIVEPPSVGHVVGEPPVLVLVAGSSTFSILRIAAPGRNWRGVVAGAVLRWLWAGPFWAIWAYPTVALLLRDALHVTRAPAVTGPPLHPSAWL